MKLVDTHTHIYANEFSDDIDSVIAHSLDNHVSKVYMPNIDTSTIEAMLTLEAQYPHYCAAMMGLHPCHVDALFQEQLLEMENWLSKRRFAAIGEIGMDLYRDKTFQAQQEEALAIQLSWAKQYQLPVVIHCRAAFHETLAILEKQQKGQLRGIFHCFSGTLEEAERILALGFYLGIGGIVTFKNAGLDQVVAQLDLNKIVLETDAPYLAPVPYRGKRNEPAHLLHIAERIAEIKETDLATVAAVTTKNVINVFGED